MNKITVFCEIDCEKLSLVSYELISKAFELSNRAKELNKQNFEVEAVVVSNSIDANSKELAYNCGCNKFVLIKCDNKSKIDVSSGFVEYITKNPPSFILFPATVTGRIIAPRICAMLDTGLVADCTGLDVILKNDEIKLAPTRPTFGSELMATILSKKNPQCATIRPKVFLSDFTNRQKNVEFIEFASNCFKKDDKLKLIDSFKDNSSNNVKEDLLKAKTVIVAGFGLYDGSDTYYKKLKKIAKKMGANYAVTRKVVDFGLENQDYQIGQTGLTISPKLYIAFGVSGAIQHIMGMKNSDKIIAINTDSNADIFNYCDYKIIADAREIIDSL